MSPSKHIKKSKKLHRKVNRLKDSENKRDFLLEKRNSFVVQFKELINNLPTSLKSSIKSLDNVETLKTITLDEVDDFELSVGPVILPSSNTDNEADYFKKNIEVNTDKDNLKKSANQEWKEVHDKILQLLQESDEDDGVVK